MPGGEPVVTQEHLHLALAALRQTGVDELLARLNVLEPHLVEHIRSICGLLRDDLSRMRLSPEQARRVTKDFESLAAVVSFAWHLGHSVRCHAAVPHADPTHDPDRPDPSLN